MVEVWLPYGRSEIPVRVPEERLIDILKPDPANHLADPVNQAATLIKSDDAFIRKASEAAKVCVALGYCGSSQLTNELTRTVLECVGNARNSATVLCTGESFEPDPQAIGTSQVRKHNGKAETLECSPAVNDFTVQIDSEFINADLRVAIGELRPHQFLKYAGLCDVVFPGLGSSSSVLAESSDRAGLSLDNLREERAQVAKQFKNLYGLGFNLDGEMRPTNVIFADWESCLRSLEPLVEGQYSKHVTKRADIAVIGSGGSPFDSTLARAVEGLPAGLSALKREGALILAAESGEGHGGGSFYKWSADGKEARYLEARLKHRFNYEGYKAAYLRRSLQSHRVYLVSTIPDHYVESVFGMKPAVTVNAALQSAQRALGSDSSISVIPNACRVIAKSPDS